MAFEGLLDFLTQTLGTGTGVTKKPYAGYSDLLEWVYRFVSFCVCCFEAYLSQIFYNVCIFLSILYLFVFSVSLKVFTPKRLLVLKLFRVSIFSNHLFKTFL